VSLDVSLYDPTATYETEELYSANITHNLAEMAEEAGIYKALWKPHKLNKENPDTDVVAQDIIDVIEKGLADLKKRPEYFKQFDSPNGWGMYEHFVPFVEKYLEALKQYPEALVETDV